MSFKWWYILFERKCNTSGVFLKTWPLLWRYKHVCQCKYLGNFLKSGLTVRHAYWKKINIIYRRDVSLTIYCPWWYTVANFWHPIRRCVILVWYSKGIGLKKIPVCSQHTALYGDMVLCQKNSTCTCFQPWSCYRTFWLPCSWMYNTRRKCWTLFFPFFSQHTVVTWWSIAKLLDERYTL